MTTSNAMFGNPWHGKLSTGSIELVTDTPVTSITVDGVAHTVKTVGGNLGDTRYYKPPYLPDDPVTPQQVIDLNGKFKRDMILFADSCRYSPLNDGQILEITESAGSGTIEWLLWDTTALAWRKMKISYAFTDLSTNVNSPSAANSTCMNFSLYRGDLFGKIFDTTETTPTWTLVSTLQTLPYRYVRGTAFYGYGGAYCPSGRKLGLDARRDGARIILQIASSRAWNIDSFKQVDYYPAPSYSLLEVSSTVFLQDAFELILEDDGATIASITGINVTQETVTSQPSDQMRMVSEGEPYFVEPESWYVPISVEWKVDTGVYGIGSSSYVSACYDASGAKKFAYIVATARRITTWVESADVYIGFNDGSEVPEYTVGPTSWTNESAWYGLSPRAEFKENYVIGSPTYTDSRSYKLTDGTTVIQEWADVFDSSVLFTQTTNNVVSLSVGADSIGRVGPGAVDITVLENPVYASFNPRTGVVVSSASPIGFV